MQLNSIRREEYGIIDFADPDHIHPTDGAYGLELLIGDYKIEAKRWRFLNVDCKFQANSPPSDDSTNKLKENIVRLIFIVDMLIALCSI